MGLETSEESRRAKAAFALYDRGGSAVQQGEASAAIGDEALSLGTVSVSFLDADALRASDYRIELDLWPDGRLILSQLGRRFETFTRELRRTRNQARVAGLLAHGISVPKVFTGAVLSSVAACPAELQLYDTHLTVVPQDGDPWQVPLGAVTDVRAQVEPPAVVLRTETTATAVGLLGRHCDAFRRAIMERIEAQARLLKHLTGQDGFADGLGVPRLRIPGFEQLLERFTAPERTSCAGQLLTAASDEPRLGFVQLLDPDAEGLQSPDALPENWASFLLVPIGDLTVLEILAGPSAATYVFRSAIDAVNRDLQALHLRRSPLALTKPQAELTPANPNRLALRKLEPLRRLRACTTARLIHTDSWAEAWKRIR
jgi:hypothetical protein